MSDRSGSDGPRTGPDPEASSAPLSVFCGKGGVGKTTLSLGLGLALARAGRRTLVVTSHPLPELALSISLDGLDQQDPASAERLFVIYIDPRQVLAEVVGAQIPSRGIAKRVLESRIYNNLIEIAPGLKEMAFLSRLRDVSHSRTADGGFDHVVWDAPATGHFVEILRVMRKFETYLTGPFAVRGRDLASFFGRADLRLLPVTTLEEMAIDEVLELVERLTDEFRLEPAGIVLNLVSPLLSDAPLPAAAGTGNAAIDIVLERLRVEREHFRRVRDAVRADCHPVPRVRGQASDLVLLDRLAESLRPLGGVGA